MTPELIAFYTALTTTLAGTLTFIVRAILKSNCTHCKCCGAECTRDTTHVPQELDLEINPVSKV